MSWLITAKQYIPAVIGEPFGGGYFAGYISHTADGNPTHALIVAPEDTGATVLQWKTSNITTVDTTSTFDGAANTAAMVTAGIEDHPAANFCVNLGIGGYSDWYLPAQYELDIAYFNLKPTTAANNTLWGINDYSVPKRTVNFTTGYPIQTSLADFQDGATEAFSPTLHWFSNEVSPNAWCLDFASGSQVAVARNFSRSVRAFRRIAL